MHIKQPDSFKSLIYACENDNRIAYKTKTRSISYDSFFKDVISAQKYFSHGFFEQNIIIHAKPSYEWIVLFFGLQLAGKTTILIDDTTSHEMLIEICNQYNTSTVIDDFNRNDCAVDISQQESICNNHTFDISNKNQSNTHISAVIFTSGTSDNKPKGVALSEGGLLASAFYGHRAANVTGADTLLHILPFHHAFGLAAEVIAPIMSKTPLCFGDKLATIFNDINHYKITAIYAVPQIINGLLFCLTKKSLPTLKKITNGSAPLSKETVESVLSHDLELHVSYGLSECSPCVAVSKPVNTFDEYYSGDILPCCDIEISSGGEICVFGTNIMIGYYDGSKINRNNISDGLFHTGDTGYLKNNKLYVTGRLKDILVFNNGKKFSKSFFEKEIIKVTGAKECYVFSNEDRLNIILNKPKKELDIEKIIEVMPRGIKLGDIYEKPDALEKTRLKKVINSSKVQLSNCKKLN